MSELKPCPFCGESTVIRHDNTMWTGMRQKILSVELRHWCDEANILRRVHVNAKGKTHEEAVELWNRRADQQDKP